MNQSPYGNLINSLIAAAIWALIGVSFYKMYRGIRLLSSSIKNALQNEKLEAIRLHNMADDFTTSKHDLQLLMLFIRQCVSLITTQCLFASFMTAALISNFLGHSNTLFSLLLVAGLVLLQSSVGDANTRINAMIDGAFKHAKRNSIEN